MNKIKFCSHLFFFLASPSTCFILSRIARSRTVLTPSMVITEHSRHFAAFNCSATFDRTSKLMGAWSLPASLSIVALSCQRSVYVPTRRMVGAESPLQRILIFGIQLSETFSRDPDITVEKQTRNMS